MNPKQRVHAALKRQPSDRVPIFMWFHPETARKLSRLLEIPVSALGEAMGNDICQTWVNNNYAMEGIEHDRDGETHLDWWGITWEKRHGFNQILKYPLAGASREQVLAYRFPSERKEDLLALMEPVLSNRRDFFIGCDVSPCVFEMYWRLRGMADGMLDMAGDPTLAFEMFERCADFSIELGAAACDRFQLDWYWTGDDIAGQRSMLMSPRLWRTQIKPHLQRVIDVGIAHKLPIAFHCCGAARPIIPDLIEIGVNILNPIQSNCPGMNPVELKREYGRHLTFMGGVDTQEMLPHATAAEVRRATEELIGIMTADGGGYILAASHTISPETPDDNIFAMYEAAGVSKAEIFDQAASLRRSIAAPVHPS
jgi:uroporphyrinogen decarboxylase